MSLYKNSTDMFSITSSMENFSNGPEIFSLTDKAAVPIPGALLLLESGLVGLIGFRRFRKL